MYTKILAPLDGSERAETILRHVEDIAHHYKAKVVLLSVLEPVQTVVAPDGIYVPSEDIIEERKHAMEEYLLEKQKQLQAKDIDVKTVVAYGRIIDEICDIATAENVDLVAMASHGRTGLSRVFYGSVAAGVLHRIDRPLLLIRAE